MQFEIAAPAPQPAATGVVRRYRDGSRVEMSDVPGFFVAVTPKGTRLRDSGTRLVMLFPSADEAEWAVTMLGYGLDSGEVA